LHIVNVGANPFSEDEEDVDEFETPRAEPISNDETVVNVVCVNNEDDSIEDHNDQPDTTLDNGNVDVGVESTIDVVSSSTGLQEDENIDKDVDKQVDKEVEEEIDDKDVNEVVNNEVKKVNEEVDNDMDLVVEPTSRYFNEEDINDNDDGSRTHIEEEEETKPTLPSDVSTTQLTEGEAPSLSVVVNTQDGDGSTCEKGGEHDDSTEVVSHPNDAVEDSNPVCGADDDDTNPFGDSDSDDDKPAEGDLTLDDKADEVSEGGEKNVGLSEVPKDSADVHISDDELKTTESTPKIQIEVEDDSATIITTKETNNATTLTTLQVHNEQHDSELSDNPRESLFVVTSDNPFTDTDSEKDDEQKNTGPCDDSTNKDELPCDVGVEAETKPEEPAPTKKPRVKKLKKKSVELNPFLSSSDEE
jgi:hypothetical protein